MKLFAAKKMTMIAFLSGAMALSACSSDQVIDNTVGVAAGGTKMVAKGVVGAGKLAYKGGKAVIGGDE